MKRCYNCHYAQQAKEKGMVICNLHHLVVFEGSMPCDEWSEPWVIF